MAATRVNRSGEAGARMRWSDGHESIHFPADGTSLSGGVRSRELSARARRGNRQPA